MKSNTIKLALALSTTAAALVLGNPALAQAQSDDQSSKDDVIVTAQQALKQVVSSGDIGVLGSKDALSTPFNVSNYTAQLVLDQQSTTLGDVLENDPAVRTTYGSGNQSELFVIRGFALNGDDVSINGLYGVTPRQLVSPELYEGVQVLNGANAFLFGAAPSGSGIGGGINLVPKRADKTLFRATASYNQNSIFGGNFDAGGRFGGDDAFGLRLVGVYRDGETSVDHEHRKVGVIGGSFDFRKGPGRFFVDFGYEDQEASWSRPSVRLAPGAAVPGAPDPTYNYGQPWTYTRLRDLYVLTRAELDLAPNVLLYSAFGFRDGHEYGDYSTLTITNGVTGDGTASRLYVPRTDHNQAGQIGIRGKVTTGGISNEFNLGVSMNFTENRNSFSFGAFPKAVRTACGAASTSFCTNLYNAPIVDRPTNSTLPSSGGSLTDLPRVARTEFLSLFASDTIGFFDDRFQITAGLRQQKMIIDAYSRGTRLRTSEYDKSATTPVVGVIFKPADNISLYANRIEGLAQGPTAPLNAATINPGEVFPPFRSVQYEVGGKIGFRGLTGTIALYQTKQPSAYSVPVSPTQVQFVVDGEQRNQGIELTLNGEPTKGVRFIGGVSINDAKLTHTLGGTNDGKKVVGVPDYQVNFGTEIVLPFMRKMTFTGRVVLTGKQMIDVANTQELPAWARFDLGLRYNMVMDGHPITMRVSAENIANKAYWASSFGGYLVQGTPRTVKASLTFEY
ncbi:TonB-dependent receptor [Sphingomonas lycopersici]|uniref:TonB-dependent receptor n=1 Tax=Sphingomonas lycopersici TaxID=2951807 RepID=A0AA42CVL0_9SPHN|nr:TonB-dependent receptor [Sphingomonas lycopersici]MCW6536721.1 TonB-dependent receptor [Sphingomonas lycopersici]